MKERDLTVIICTYNGGERLVTVLDKLYEQNEMANYVSEVLIIDNHSTDGTKDLILQYAGRDIEVPIHYAYEPNVGLSNARKCGVDLCTTEWIAFLDDDNFLQQGWLKAVVNYIRMNPNVGAFNGAVIPEVPFAMTPDDEKRLRSSLKVLACTHYDTAQLEKNKKTPFRNPIGAGMVIRTAPLKELSVNGWLNSNGRTGEKLTSGEDGEMAFYVKNKGYDFGFCSDAVLLHQMTENRIQDEYLNRMWFEIGRGVAIVALNQNAPGWKLLAYRILLFTRMILYYMQNVYKGRYYARYISGYKQEMQSRSR